MAKMMREIVGENNAHDNVLPAMTAEDFGFMLQEVPGAYGWIGNGNDALSQGDLHSTSYDFNDKNLELGALFWEKLLSVTHNFYFVMYILIGIVVIGGLFSLLFSRDRSRLLN